MTDFDKEMEKTMRRALIQGTSFVQIKLVDPYRQPWWRRLWRRLFRRDK